MTVQITIPLLETGLYRQQDARDPLGIWAARNQATGDLTGGDMEANIQIPADRRRSRVYSCYDANTFATLGAADTATAIKIEIFTGWPDAQAAGGIQGHSTYLVVASDGNIWDNNTSFGPREPLITPLQRFLALFDPSTAFPTDALTIVRITRNANVNTTIYMFTAWGFYWDRNIFDIPGGPRHPGSQ